jgi:hypothetical protein
VPRHPSLLGDPDDQELQHSGVLWCFFQKKPDFNKAQEGIGTAKPSPLCARTALGQASQSDGGHWCLLTGKQALSFMPCFLCLPE